MIALLDTLCGLIIGFICGIIFREVKRDKPTPEPLKRGNRWS